ncbi:MAG: protein-disulfide reductase DsbD domain-containing protein [Bacteroidia bacterium]
MRSKTPFTFFTLITLIFAANNSFAQILKPVKWTFITEQTSDKEATLIFKVEMEDKFHIYSQFLVGEGPIPTTFTFEPSPVYELTGKVDEGKPVEEYDDNFQMKLKYFNDSAQFRQKIKLKDGKPFSVKGTLNFMACDNHRCLAPEDVDFLFDINKRSKSTAR